MFHCVLTVLLIKCSGINQPHCGQSLSFLFSNITASATLKFRLRQTSCSHPVFLMLAPLLIEYQYDCGSLVCLTPRRTRASSVTFQFSFIFSSSSVGAYPLGRSGKRTTLCPHAAPLLVCEHHLPPTLHISSNNHDRRCDVLYSPCKVAV